MKVIPLYIPVFILFGFLFYQIPKKDNNSGNQMISISKNHPNQEINWPWRGITIVTHMNREIVNEKAINDLAKMGVNLVRLRISFRKFQMSNKVSKEVSWNNTVNWSREVISMCNKNNIAVLISHSDFPLDSKEKNENHTRAFWENTKALDQALYDIQKITKTFDTIPGVVAFEFFSEPVISDNNQSLKPAAWDNYYKKILSKFRTISSKYLLYTPGPWADPKGYLEMGKPFKDLKIIYNVHFYQPHRYTHQGINGKKEIYKYPGLMGFQYWDKSAIEKNIDIFNKWRLKNKIEYVFVGEFSAVRWAEGKDEYLEDLLSILEKKKISWAYFALNSWYGWNYNYDLKFKSKPTINNLTSYKFTSQTKTLKTLKKYWVLNELKK